LNNAAISGRLEYLTTSSPGLASASTVSAFGVRARHHHLHSILGFGILPCVKRLSLSTIRPWYWVHAKSNASADMNSGMPLREYCSLC
jgi:hypothetical protein